MGICEKWVSKRITVCPTIRSTFCPWDHPHLVIPVFNWLLIYTRKFYTQFLMVVRLSIRTEVELQVMVKITQLKQAPGHELSKLLAQSQSGLLAKSSTLLSPIFRRVFDLIRRLTYIIDSPTYSLSPLPAMEAGLYLLLLLLLFCFTLLNNWRGSMAERENLIKLLTCIASCVNLITSMSPR